MNVFKLIYLLTYLLYDHQGPNMAEVTTSTQEPAANSLSGVALVELLMEYCNTQIIKNAKLEREYAAELTNDKIAIVVKGFGDGLATFSNEFSNNTVRSNELDDVKLKLDTALAYQEHQLFNLKKGLQDVLLKIENDTFDFLTIDDVLEQNRVCKEDNKRLHDIIAI